MKIKKIITFASCALLAFNMLYAQAQTESLEENNIEENTELESNEEGSEENFVTKTEEASENKSFFDSLKYAISADFAFYPKSDYVAGGTHFAPLTGIYSGLEGRVTGSATYVIPTPLGENWLLKDANVALKASLELTPVSIKPGFSATFTPLPFLVFAAGGEAGTGWNLLGLQGMASYDGTSSYTDITPFTSWFLKAWAQGTVQFDTGALIPGDWSHVVMLFTYQVYYQNLTGVSSGEIWEWQCSKNKADGFNQYMCGVLAYQMPLVLKRVGVMFEMEGHFADSDYNTSKYADYNGNFQSISISPLAQFEFDKHNSLSVLIGFSSRRSYEESHTDDAVEPNLTYAGREWYFNRVAVSYTYSF